MLDFLFEFLANVPPQTAVFLTVLTPLLVEVAKRFGWFADNPARLNLVLNFVAWVVVRAVAYAFFGGDIAGAEGTAFDQLVLIIVSTILTWITSTGFFEAVRRQVGVTNRR